MQKINWFTSTGIRKVRVSCLCHSDGQHVQPPRRNKNLIKVMGSLALLPVLAAAPLGGYLGFAQSNASNVPQIVLSQQDNMTASAVLAFNQAMQEKSQTLQEQAKAIDTYFSSHKMPLKGTGMKMAVEADKNNLDYRLIPAIAVEESTGGIHDCDYAEHNPFGWDSCKTSFKSDDDAIEVLAKNLSGKNPNTAKHYAGKPTKAILEKYNPPSVVPDYASQVMGIMSAIGKEDITLSTTTINNG